MDTNARLITGIFIFLIGGSLIAEGILLLLNDKYVALMIRFNGWVTRIFQGVDAARKEIGKHNSFSSRRLNGIFYLISGTFLLTLSLLMIIRSILK